MSSAALTELQVVPQAPSSLEESVAATLSNVDEAHRLLDAASVSLLTYDDYADVLKLTHPAWLTSSHRDAQLVRLIEELRSKLEQTDAHGQVATALEPVIDVAELATRIGRTVGTTRRLLEKGLIPGAERKTPGMKNSPWLIPATSPTLYLERLS